MEKYDLVLLQDNHPTDGFADVYFRNAAGEPHYIQEGFNGCRWGMYGFRDNEEFTAPNLLDLFGELYRAMYVIHDPFNLIWRHRIWNK